MTKRKGQTLIEVVVATMVAAMTATAVFSVVLSSSVSGGRSDRKEAAALAINAAREQLRMFVSADPGSSVYSPNAGGLWTGKDNSGVWALQSGTHNMSASFLSGFPLLSGRSPQMSYTVSDENCGFGTGTAACKKVVFTISYND